jgi:hypothetical protein
MEPDVAPSRKPDLAEVQKRFDNWRAHRKRGASIPAALWEGAVSLCADHSPYKISRALHLDYNALKKRSQSACPDHFPESVMASDFVALDLRSSLPGGECIIEMERAGGKMWIHIKGAPGFHPLELMKMFWGCG